MVRLACIVATLLACSHPDTEAHGSASRNPSGGMDEPRDEIVPDPAPAQRLPADTPYPRACEADGDCTIVMSDPAENPCCDYTVSWQPRAIAYVESVRQWRSTHCADVHCAPGNFPGAQPAACANVPRCIEGSCDNSCGEPGASEGSVSTGLPSPSSLSVRAVPAHSVVPAEPGSARSLAARLALTLFVRGTPGLTLTTITPWASSLTWSIVGDDGTAWQPVFMPPPLPPVTGWPTTTVTIPPSGEAEFAHVSGISGFQRPGMTTRSEVLPTGRYRVQVSGMLGDGTTYVAPPFTLTVE